MNRMGHLHGLEDQTVCEPKACQTHLLYLSNSILRRKHRWFHTKSRRILLVIVDLPPQRGFHRRWTCRCDGCSEWRTDKVIQGYPENAGRPKPQTACLVDAANSDVIHSLEEYIHALEVKPLGRYGSVYGSVSTYVSVYHRGVGSASHPPGWPYSAS